MAKRKETLEIEKALLQMCQEKGVYGCEEITIGFVNGGLGNEIVDFMTMDSKGIIRSYEIKVTMQDLKSKAKKSWYGHYNYLVVSLDLYEKIISEISKNNFNWNDYLPEGVGVLLAQQRQYLPTMEFHCMFKPNKQSISSETAIMLKESMVRSLYYKMVKYMDAQSIEKMKALQKDARRWEKFYREEQKERSNLLRKTNTYLRLIRAKKGNYVSLDELIEEEEVKAIRKAEAI